MEYQYKLDKDKNDHSEINLDNTIKNRSDIQNPQESIAEQLHTMNNLDVSNEIDQMEYQTRN